MMILGIGTDFVDSRRIEKLLHRFPKRFLNRILTHGEQQYLRQRKGCFTLNVSKVFAVKEASMKAIGTGVSVMVSWQDIGLTHDALGKPLLNFSPRVLTYLHKHFGISHKITAHVSLSDEVPYALAFVVICAD